MKHPYTLSDWHDVTQRFSIVSPKSATVDPMRRFCQPGLQFDVADERLAMLAETLEAAYGYRAPKLGRRYTRRAPSAGALYPTEIFCIGSWSGRTECLYYSFADHGFYRVAAADVNSCVRAPGHDGNRITLICVSVLWRSVQRYGVRAYRYCLLDAAAVLDNVVRAWLARGGRVAPSMPAVTPDMEAALGLCRDEAAVACVELNGALMRRRKSSPVDHGPVPPQYPNETPPELSPMLERVIRLHRGTLLEAARQEAIWEPDAACPHAPPGAPDLRYSVKRFSGQPLDEALVKSLTAWVRTLSLIRTPQVGGTAPQVTFVKLLNDGADSQDTERDGSIDYVATEPDFLKACQNQSVVTGATHAAVITFAERVLHECSAQYRHAILNAGLVVATFYRAAVSLGIGTTCVGGFIDDAILQLLPGIDGWPVIVQLFGHCSAAGEKVDALSRMEERLVGRQPDTVYMS